MKTFDIRAAFIEKPAQGQQKLGGHNSANNCVPDSLLECYQALTGKWPCNPQDLTTAVYGAGYSGGETFSAIAAKMRQRTDLFPDLPPLEVYDFGSRCPPDWIGEYGAQGFPMAASFYCDTNGKILTYRSNSLHASCPVGCDGQRVTVWNVEGYEVTFTLADFARAYQGALVIFKRSVHRQMSPIPEEDDMQQQRLDAEHPSAKWVGLFQGKPGPYADRDIYAAVAGDTFIGTKDKTVVRFYFVRTDGTPAVKEVTVSGSQQATIGSPLTPDPAGVGVEQHVRAELISGGPVDVRVYSELKP